MRFTAKLRDYVTNSWDIFTSLGTHSVAVPFMEKPKPVLPLATRNILTDLKFHCGVLRSVPVGAFAQRRVLVYGRRSGTTYPSHLNP